MEFRILGPLEVWRDDIEVPIAAGKHRALLATLLLRANRVVTTDELIARIWGDRPPGDARATAQTYVRRLRATLGHDLIGTRPGGYLMPLTNDQLDLLRFDDLLAQARGEADPLREAQLLADALELWRGDALADVPSDLLHRDEVPALTERRLRALERHFDLGLESGGHSDLIPDLRQAHFQHPLRERFCAQLMIALTRSGRQSEALRTYAELRHRLVDELGLDPGSEIQELHHDILRGDIPVPATTQAGPTHVSQVSPAQLPADITAFTGRDDSVAVLNSLLPEGGDVTSGVVKLALIEGMAGIGKTALAVHWGHQVREHFPDGQLYVNLHGNAASGRRCAADALAGFLTALGVPVAEIPSDIDRAATMFRSLLADKRMLIVLDDAADADQVRPLLPGSGGSLILVTSREHLAGLVARDGAEALALGVLELDDSIALLTSLLSSRHVATEQAALNDLATLCGNLPLALRIAAANLMRHPHHSLRSYLQHLQHSDWMSSLAIAGDQDSAVAAAFDISYQRLAEPAQKLFRFAALIPGPDVTPGSAAAVSGISTDAAEGILDDLAGRHLLEARAPDRFAFHDLLHRYAAARVAYDDSEPERQDALMRLYRFYVEGANSAASILYPDILRMPEQPNPRPDTYGLVSTSRAMEWLDVERRNLVAAIRRTEVSGPPDVAWLIADALRGYFYMRGPWVEWEASVDAALATTRAEHHAQGQVAARLSLSNLRWRQGRHDDALLLATEALALAREAAWGEGESAAHANLGAMCSNASRLDHATEHLSAALNTYDTNSRSPGKGVTLGNLGVVHLQGGRLDEAAARAAEALELNHEINAHNAEASNRAVLGEVNLAWGNFDVALDHFSHALSLYELIGNRVGAGLTLSNMAKTHRDAGRIEQAFDVAYRALDLADDRETILRVDALIAVAAAHERMGEYQAACEYYDTALRLADVLPDSYSRTEALLGLATIHVGTKQAERAAELFTTALAVSQESSFLLHEGHALTGLAAASLAQDRVQQAASQGERALEVHRTTGHRLGQMRTHLVLARAHARRGNAREADSHQVSAETIASGIGLPGADESASGLVEQLAG